MSLFSSKENETDRLLEKYHLNNLPIEDLETVIQIANDLAGNGLITFGTRLSGKPEDVAKMTYLSAIVRQNWIMINQLSRISESLQQSEQKKRIEHKSEPENRRLMDNVIPGSYSKEEVIRILIDHRKQFTDDTNNGGRLWILSDSEVDRWIKGITIDGKTPKHTIGAGMLNGKPGWYVD